MRDKYIIRRISDIEKERSICGYRQRLITAEDFEGANVTFLNVYEAKTHYHKRTTEFYYVLSGKGQIELDGERVDVDPGTLIMIRPGTRHRAIGDIQALIVGVPPFDPEDSFEE